MLKAIKIRLYPTNEQRQVISSLLGSYRFIYNQCLNHKIQNYENDKTNISFYDLTKFFSSQLRNEFDWLKQHNTKVLKQSIINLDIAYKNFIKLHKGYPKFKTKSDDQKARFPNEAISKNPFDESSSRLNLTKTIKDLKFECSDRDKNYLFKNKDKIKSITLIKTKSCNYYATILIDGDLLKSVDNPINNSVGIDLGIKSLLTLSNGESIDNPKWIRSNERKLKKLQRQLSKKKKGSKNRNKARIRLAKLHEKIKNQKQDFIHNLTSKIINENQIIVLEDLNVKGMMKNHKLSKSIQELGLGEIRRQLEYKSNWYGRNLILVDRWYASSKICSCCGHKKDKLTLREREYKCEECGNVIDRDYNASINIEREGLRIYNEKIVA
jgi:putative transposase